MTEDFPPFNFESQGRLTGLTTETVRLLFKKNKIPVEFKLWPWARAYNAALNKEFHFVFTTSRTEDREKLFKWVGPIAQDSFYLAAPASSKIAYVDDFKKLNHLRISGIAEDSPVLFLEKYGFKFVLTQDNEARGRMLRKGQLDIDILSDSSHRHYEDIYKLKMKKVAPMYKTDYYLAFNLGTPDELIKSLNDSLIQIIASPEYKKLEQQFYNQER